MSIWTELDLSIMESIVLLESIVSHDDWCRRGRAGGRGNSTPSQTHSNERLIGKERGFARTWPHRCTKECYYIFSLSFSSSCSHLFNVFFPPCLNCFLHNIHFVSQYQSSALYVGCWPVHNLFAFFSFLFLYSLLPFCSFC